MLSDVVQFLDSQRVPITAKDRKPGPYPYYGANGLQDRVADYIFDEKLVLLAEDGGYFDDPTRPISYLVEGKCWVNNHAHVLRATSAIIPEYLNYQLAFANVSAFLSGTTRPKLTKSDAARIPVLVPPIAEQRLIVDLLSRAENIVRMRREAEARTNAIIPALFVEMFGDPSNAERGGRDGASTEAMDTSINGNTLRLEDLALAVVDCPHSTPDFAEDGVVCLRTTNLGIGRWQWHERRYVSKEDYAVRTRRATLEAGDIIISREGTLGIGAIVEPTMQLCMGQRLVQIRVNEKIATPEFLLWHLLGVLNPEAVEKHLAGSTSKHLNLSSLKAMTLSVPPLTSQKTFSDLSSSAMNQVALQERATARAESAFQSLLAGVFQQ